MPKLGARIPMEERFWSKVDKGDGSGCWVWTGARVGGYGCLGKPGTTGTVKAHRYSAMLHFGMFDSRLCVMHTCDNPPCVNPAHLALGTNADNTADMKRKDRAVSPNAAKTHCKRGHELTEENTYRQPRHGGSGHADARVCRICRKHQGRYRGVLVPEYPHADVTVITEVDVE